MSLSDPTFSEIMEDPSPEGETPAERPMGCAGSEDRGDGLFPPEEESAKAPAEKQAKIPSIPVIRREVSGRYLGVTGAFKLELRVDVDRRRPMRRISGDFYQVRGTTTAYFGSFIVHTPSIGRTATLVTVKGAGTFTFAASAPVVRVTIPRRALTQPQAPATVIFYTTDGSQGASYLAAFESIYFRTLFMETDRVSDLQTPVFSSYDTGLLPSGGPPRDLSVANAYAEAGIEMIETGGTDEIPIGEAGYNASWSNAELHAAMQNHFTLWKNREQWAVWLLSAQRHEMGDGLYGIMFDQHGRQRQGCAVFHAGIGGTESRQLRVQLYTYVHELGHCFNLMHSWQKAYAAPPAPNRPGSLSWMNYPWIYPGGGAAAFWNRFAFQFDNEELIHLRHAFRNSIIMGGNPFTSGASLHAEIMGEPVLDLSGLKLCISTHQRRFALGEPVLLQLAIQTDDPEKRPVHTWLSPSCGMVKVVIRKPGGEVIPYTPLIDHLVGERTGAICMKQPVRESAYIGFGKDGFYFDRPGSYLIRASYAALDGSEIVSNILTIRVRYPVTAQEESLADLFMGEDQGALLYLLGSDDASLRRGNDAFDEVLERHGKHPMAHYVRLVRGINAERDFKTVTAEKKVTIRAARLDESAKLLCTAAESGVLDRLTTRMAYECLAKAQTRSGDEEGAKATLSTLQTMTEKGE